LLLHYHAGRLSGFGSGGRLLGHLGGGSGGEIVDGGGDVQLEVAEIRTAIGKGGE
jgi:hypothetical protein